jgi:hypothetical protein
MKNLKNFEEDLVYKATISVTNYVYSILDQLPEDEKFGIIYRLRTQANTVLGDASLAVGNLTHLGNEYEWSTLHKNSIALKALHDLAVGQEYISNNPEFNINISLIITEAKKNFESSKKKAEKFNKKDQDSWSKRYAEWTKMREEESKEQ